MTDTKVVPLAHKIVDKLAALNATPTNAHEAAGLRLRGSADPMHAGVAPNTQHSEGGAERGRFYQSTVWECPDCAFAFDILHTSEGGKYDCPVCNESKLRAQLEEARRERGDIENLCADQFMAELNSRGIQTENWDGDDDLWPTLARCVATRVEQAEQRAESAERERDELKKRGDLDD